MVNVIFTALGDDRVGLVDALASAISSNGGSWTQSQMSRLANKFAVIAVATVPDDRVDTVRSDLDQIESSGLLDITVEVVDDGELAEPSNAASYHLTLLGQDRPGIIRELSHGLAELGAGIDDMSTESRQAPMSADLLFEVEAVIAVPDGVDIDDIEESLGSLMTEFTIEIEELVSTV